MNDLVQRRLVPYALAASLLLNVFLLGFVFARLAAPPARRPPRVEAPERPHGRPMRALFRHNRKALRADRARIHRARRAVRDALLAEPFETAQLERSLAELRDATGDAQQTLHDTLVRTAPSLSREERKALSRAHRLWRGPGGARRGKHRRR